MLQDASSADTDDQKRYEFPSFPFPNPYPIQLGFMQELYHCLENGGVGLLESPTGTGKTISIICSSLQWLLDHREKMMKERQQQHVQEQRQRQVPGLEATDDLPDWLMEPSVPVGCCALIITISILKTEAEIMMMQTNGLASK